MSFNGLLNNKCKIEKRTVTEDSTGQRNESWTDEHINVKCRLDGASGTEFASNSNVLSRATHILFMDKKYTISTSQNRIYVDNNEYNILLVRNAGGHNHHYELVLELIQS